MRIAQIIDSLESGGAERIAVNYANGLSGLIPFSALIVTRSEGALKSHIGEKVPYFFLKKTKALDFKAVFALRNIVKRNGIEILHAHGTSFFIAVLLKLVYPKIRIVWHEHYGGRASQVRRDNLVLYLSAVFFSAVFVVNRQLEQWVRKSLPVKQVSYIPNYADLKPGNGAKTVLKGRDGKKIILVANLKNPKNHLAALKGFRGLKLSKAGWSLHFVGKDYQDAYSEALKDYIKSHGLEESVFLYGSREDIAAILEQAAIGILCSTEEGFPVALLEYGMAKLPVLSTNAGFCAEIISEGHSGLLFDPSRPGSFEEQLHKMIQAPPEIINQFGLHLQQSVKRQYTESRVMQLLLCEYQSL